MKKKSPKANVPMRFSEFLADPVVATAFVVIALIALVFSILEFGWSLSY